MSFSSVSTQALAGEKTVESQPLAEQLPVVCIVGQTAVGKTAVAEKLAQRFATSVISADAAQVYRGMDIGTAKTPVSQRLVPLEMIDVADPHENYSAELFQQQTRRCIDAHRAQKTLPILCGGTGLYLNAAIDVMEFPAGDFTSSSRQKYTEFLDQNGVEALHALLFSKDPASAALIHPNNTKRVIRALEYCDEGLSYAQINQGLHKHTPYYPALLFGLNLDRARLYERINTRVDQMFEQGLVDEVRRLDAHNIRQSKTASQAIGYKEILDALDGTISFAEARNLIKRNTRRLAKRQMTWLRRDARILWISLDEKTVDEAAAQIAEQITTYLSTHDAPLLAAQIASQPALQKRER